MTDRSPRDRDMAAQGGASIALLAAAGGPSSLALLAVAGVAVAGGLGALAALRRRRAR